MNTLPLDSISLVGIFFLIGLLLCIAIEIGYRLGLWRHVRTPGEKEAPVGAMVASIFGLLAFILGFTFSMAATRFDSRRMMVLEESNAIGTTYLRARLLEAPERSEITRLLREYVDVRLQGVATGDLAGTIARSEVLHEQLWKQAIALTQKEPVSIIAGLFIHSLNEVIDLHAKRLLGVRSRIPTVIWIVLISLAFLGMLSVGYQAGLSTTRRSPAMLVLGVAFAGVLTLVADLDRGQEGFLRVSQQAMIDLQNSQKAMPN